MSYLVIHQLFDSTKIIPLHCICVDHFFRTFTDKVVFKKSLNIGGKLSGLQIPDDFILNYSDGLQNFNEPMNFATKLSIDGTLTIADKLNDYNMAKMCELFEPPPNVLQNLTVRGKLMHFVSLDSRKLIIFLIFWSFR